LDHLSRRFQSVVEPHPGGVSNACCEPSPSMKIYGNGRDDSLAREVIAQTG
jgi:hypothetical protein